MNLFQISIGLSFFQFIIIYLISILQVGLLFYFKVVIKNYLRKKNKKTCIFNSVNYFVQTAFCALGVLKKMFIKFKKIKVTKNSKV